MAKASRGLRQCRVRMALEAADGYSMPGGACVFRHNAGKLAASCNNADKFAHNACPVSHFTGKRKPGTGHPGSTPCLLPLKLSEERAGADPLCIGSRENGLPGTGTRKRDLQEGRGQDVA